MTTYKDIHGTKVEVRTDDPANPVNGQVWYNSGTLKGFKVSTVGAWATGNAVNAARQLPSWWRNSNFCINLVEIQEVTVNNESYNGSSWTEVNNLNTGRHAASFAGADNTAALVFTGYSDSYVAITKLWNGTSWTEVNDINTARGTCFSRSRHNYSCISFWWKC